MARRRNESAALTAAVAEARKTGHPTDEIAAKHGVAPRTLRRRLTEKPARARAKPTRRKSPAPAPLPPALGQPPLTPSRPEPEDESLAIEEDTLAVARRMLRRLERDYKTADNSRDKSGLGEKVLSALGRVEQILARRPPPPRPDVVLEELRRLDLEAIAKIEEHLPDPIKSEEI